MIIFKKWQKTHLPSKTSILIDHLSGVCYCLTNQGVVELYSYWFAPWSITRKISYYSVHLKSKKHNHPLSLYSWLPCILLSPEAQQQSWARQGRKGEQDLKSSQGASFQGYQAIHTIPNIYNPKKLQWHLTVSREKNLQIQNEATQPTKSWLCGQGGPEQGSVFYALQDHGTPERTAAVVICTRPAQERASQQFSTEGEGLPSPTPEDLWTANGFWERESQLSLRVWLLISKSTTIQWMAPHPGIHGSINWTQQVI